MARTDVESPELPDEAEGLMGEEEEESGEEESGEEDSEEEVSPEEQGRRATHEERFCRTAATFCEHKFFAHLCVAPFCSRMCLPRRSLSTWSR